MITLFTRSCREDAKIFKVKVVFRSLYSRHTESVQLLCLLKIFFGLALIVLEELAQFTFLHTKFDFSVWVFFFLDPNKWMLTNHQPFVFSDR